jgi:hypothetical protein
MSKGIVHQAISLVPVIELAPASFATQDRSLPSAQEKEGWDERYCYWRDALADSGVMGLQPIRSGSWHVPTKEFTDPTTLRNVLVAILRQEGIDYLSDPASIPVFEGGLALCGSGGEVLVEPTCCSDLANLSDWRLAANHRGSEWRMVWIGHPWLSVRFEEPWLVLSQPHESENPEEGWAFRPELLERALAAAEAELDLFAGRLAAVLPLLGNVENPGGVARRLAGLHG